MEQTRIQMELSAAEQAAVERLRMTPQQRQDEVESRRRQWLDSLAPEQKQAAEQRRLSLAAMPPSQRRAYLAAQRLAGTARLLRRDAARGVSLADVLAAIDSGGRDDVAWLAGELKKTE